MKRLLPATILLLVLFACGKKEEPAPKIPPTPATQAPPQAEPSPVSPPEPSSEPSIPSDEKAKLASGSYVVVKGDTLYSIAKKNNLDYRDLAKWNKIKDPRRLRVGQELRLTAPGN